MCRSPNFKKSAGLFFILILVLAPYSPSIAAHPSYLDNSREHSIASPGEKLALSGFFPPAMDTLDVQGNYAYVGAGASLLVIDVSNPDNPRQVAYRLLPASVRKVVATTGRVYVLSNGDQVMIFDISQPASPFLVGIYSGVAPQNMDADGTRLYLGGVNGLYILDASSPDAVTLQGTLPLSGMYDPEVFKVIGDRIVMVNTDYSNGQVFVADVSDPAHPAVLGQPLNLPGFTPFYNLAISGNIAALAGIIPGGSFDQSVVALIDISDPKHLVDVNSISLPVGTYPSASIEGNWLYAATENRAITIYDISNPVSPLESGNIQAKTRSLVARGNFIYVAAGSDGFTIYDAGGSNNPSPRGTLLGVGLASDVAVQDGILYVADGGVGDPGYYDSVFGGLSVLNAQRVDSIFTIDKIYSAPGNQVTLDGNRAYLTGGNCELTKYNPSCQRGISMLDISDPGSVSTLQWFDLTDPVYEPPGSTIPGPVAIQNQIAYIANTWQGLSIVDFGQNDNPILLGYYPHNSLTIPGVTGVAITGTYALVSSQTYQDSPQPSLQVLDVSNPMTPTALTEYDMSDPHQITLAGSLAFLADGSAGLKVLDVSHLPQVTVLGALDTPGTALDVAYDGRYAYVADGDGGLRMIDVSDPSHPLEVDAFDTAGRAVNVTVAGDHIYLADETGGILVFSVVKPQSYLTLLMH